MADSQYLQDNLKGFVPNVISDEILGMTVRGSSILRLSKVEMMESDNKTFSVMSKGVGAFWTKEAGRIQTSTAEWTFPKLEAEKIAVIIPVTKEKLGDTTIDVFGQLRPYIAEAFYEAIDSACLFGTNSPFADSIYSIVSSSGQGIAAGTNDKLDLDISDVMAAVEKSGFDVDGFVAGLDFKNQLRKLRDGDGNQLYVEGMGQKQLYSLPIEFNRANSWDGTKAYREDFPKALIYTSVDLILKRMADAEAGAATLDEEGVAALPLSAIKMDDTTFNFDTSYAHKTSTTDNVGLLSDLDFDSIKPKLNLYRKVVSR